ncbi:hypothetical protein L1987_55316 [Smallanthus sonchifolius]|uniref:Uncharacterized protein n=1 Tax=Smallanthus sonchifolius TaxID=185202 RepID=A0ACB9E983_9ASTR|nr:hypothetical protein L1987_55316 [Smallanthus sonchifolius]
MYQNTYIYTMLILLHPCRLHPSTLEKMCAQSWLINEIRATCSKGTEAYCKTIEYDYDDGEVENTYED